MHTFTLGIEFECVRVLFEALLLLGRNVAELTRTPLRRGLAFDWRGLHALASVLIVELLAWGIPHELLDLLRTRQYKIKAVHVRYYSAYLLRVRVHKIHRHREQIWLVG